MPLTDAAERTLIHEHKIFCQGYLRADGLWDIEGSLTDAQTYAFDSRWRGEVKAGEPVHGMHIRLTIDDDLVIRAVAAASDHAPYQVCASVAPSLQALVGAYMGRGWTRTLRRRVGGEDGCTHLTEPAGPHGDRGVSDDFSQSRRSRARWGRYGEGRGPADWQLPGVAGGRGVSAGAIAGTV